ncbi:hypothetical protein APHWI1_0155 [Anaplasma phagocytophilum str. ApWI1]|uniref:Uncharacterized protein n=1 Tax=Anaplasma phagocytophilum str. ApWI1 TaxID=1359155 RepID=A0A0F3PXP5_ANAPH|nr:hypothetical protein APHWEB_1359 [Anaplasma phagocytophilum str. Webster]KJV84676.1 hypothetical protein APHWI1_0155 [Anaplasma phagocytophilum str. ApWI1]KJV87402.1 hypothetical protein APHNYW_0665 [Anaplasma phagocytophilum str. ApNYW]KJV98763.1 hypothetical protein OTSANNIE_0925 [Anaplasma phagocytophilum str. Annie]KJZ98255.1 hypothetical protein APHDU1_1467 [Anaplasma phagocytophilum]KJZ98546.1 hypothetical protein APHCR_0170 [Anaplasma phagocytophilum str. CR1007]
MSTLASFSNTAKSLNSAFVLVHLQDMYWCYILEGYMHYVQVCPEIEYL